MAASSARRIAPREQRLVSWIAPWVPHGSTVLDVGAGTGLLAEALADSVGAVVTLIDVVNNNRSALTIRLYDGTEMPFETDAFDVAVMAFVLHHSADPTRTLREAARVGRRLVILEDCYRGPHERLVQRWTDWILNRGHGVAPAWGQVRPHEWTRFVRAAGLTLVHVQEYTPKWLGLYRDPIRHVLLVAEGDR